jgi:RsiW-degrading membrane proteinase PrsW (M82 family)
MVLPKKNQAHRFPLISILIFQMKFLPIIVRALPPQRRSSLSNASRTSAAAIQTRKHLPITLAGLSMFLLPTSVRACAACYGQSDSPMAQGMNWGILSLLGTVVLVLGAVASFFIYLARRQAVMASQPASNQPAAYGPASLSAELQLRET